MVVLVADDFGVDFLTGYGEGASPPCTPNIDALAAGGLLFRNAWANPVCSPTRAATLTGRYGFRTGLGSVGQTGVLPLSETILPEALTGYASSAIGKWHLGPQQAQMHPNNSGFGHFAGSIGGGVQNYFSWPKVVDGQSSNSTTYVTTDTTNEAITAVTSMPEPWFAWVSFNAPHSPWHVPPSTLCTAPACPNTWCDNLPPNPSNRDMGKAMVEAMDAEIGRFVNVLDLVAPNTIVLFMGDNGTPGQLSQAPFPGNHAKGTVYEGGVNVPLIARGPGIAQGECAALVSCVDLFATVGELAGVPAATEDSVSLVPYFRNPSLSLRSTVYSETFSPNGGTLPFADHDRAIRDSRYKLIRRTNQPDEFYDLQLDAFESSNLLPGLSRAEQAAYDALVAELVALGVD